MNKISHLFFIIILFCSSFQLSSQNTLPGKLSAIPSITITKKSNLHFKEYYEIFISQPLDHFKPAGPFFKQRIFLGYNDSLAPTVMETDGYNIDYADKPDFIDEPTKILEGNMIVVEHRFFGKSRPDTLDWNYLTMEQATADDHLINQLFRKILHGKWITTGISKGGQAALAYKMYFPDDADATILYSTPVKNGLYDPRINAYLQQQSLTECGTKIRALQEQLLQNKASLLPLFETIVKEKKLNFGSLSIENVFDYSVLEYPFSFWQGGYDCALVPYSTAPPAELLNELITIIPPSFYSQNNMKRLEPSFYMAYHQLGYYEYDTAPFKKWLANDTYSNRFFAPPNTTFDPAYQHALNDFIKSSKMQDLIFIYGASDSWASVQVDLPANADCLKVIVKKGGHKSRIANLESVQEKMVYKKLSVWLGSAVGNTGK